MDDLHTDRTLLIKAKGGLGNRMLSAICGLLFADLTGRRPVIDWRDGSYAPEGENAYPLLFDAPKDMAAPDTFDDWQGAVSPATWQGNLDVPAARMVHRHDPSAHSSARIYRRFCTDLSRLDAPEALAVFWCYLPKFARLAPHLRRDPRFAGRTRSAIIADYLDRYFTPNARVRAAVDSEIAAMGRPHLGVHVRYTDRKVPVHRIEAALERKLKDQPDAAIFLATDSAEIEERFAQRYGDRMHSTDKYLAADGARLHEMFSGPEGVTKQTEAENALIDILLLSRSAHLVCSRHSTFAETAILYGGMTGRVTDIDRLNAKVVIKRIVQDYL